MLHTIQETFKELVSFLKNPLDKQDADQTNAHKTKRLLAIFAIDLPVSFVLAMLIMGFEELGFVDTDNNEVVKLLESYPVIAILFLTVIIVPFIEELIFRLFLKWKRNYLIQFIVLVIPQSKEALSRFWHLHYSWVFYFSVIVFGFVHITNYEMTEIPIWVIPFLVLPQLFAGAIIGFLRVRYNFMHGFYLHALHNAFFITFALISMGRFS